MSKFINWIASRTYTQLAASAACLFLASYEAKGGNPWTATGFILAAIYAFAETPKAR